MLLKNWCIIYFHSDLWQECEFQSKQDINTPTKQPVPGRRSRFRSRPGSTRQSIKKQVPTRSKSASASKIDSKVDLEENQPDNDKIKSVIDKQNVIIDDQRKMMKEQQKQIDELRKLKDQLDSGRAITNKVCDDRILRLF